MSIRPENINLEENIGFGNELFDLISKAKAIKAKINKWHIKLKSFCTAKEVVNKAKMQPTEQEEKVFKSYIDEIISKVYKELI